MGHLLRTLLLLLLALLLLAPQPGSALKLNFRKSAGPIRAVVLPKLEAWLKGLISRWLRRPPRQAKLTLVPRWLGVGPHRGGGEEGVALGLP
jgi:hypothetical protein